MIAVRCHTNLDNCKQTNWPEVLACRPRIGEKIRAKGSYIELYIVGITHSLQFVGESTKLTPYLILELNEHWTHL